jgi:hypothetical protein
MIVNMNQQALKTFNENDIITLAWYRFFVALASRLHSSG